MRAEQKFLNKNHNIQNWPQQMDTYTINLKQSKEFVTDEKIDR